MFRIEDGKDIEENTFLQIVSPFMDVCYEYLENEIAPKYVALYLAEGYKRSALWQSSYNIHLNSALDAFTILFEDKEKIKKNVTNILLTDYKLRVVNDNPLDFEKVS